MTSTVKLVLLPGLDGTGILFEPLLRALPGHIEPIVVAYPTGMPMGYDELLPRALDAPPAEGPFILLGESFGGPLSLRVAATKPAGLCGLILCASFVTCSYWFVPPIAAHLVPDAPFRFMPTLSRMRSRIGGYADSEVAQLSIKALSQVAAPVWARRVRELIRADVQRELRDCHVPLLYLRGTRDWVVPAANMRRVMRLRSDTTLSYVPSPHLLLQSCPAEAATAITGFATRCEPKAQ